MIKIDLLQNHPESIPKLAKIWHEVLGKIWMPEIGLEEIESGYYKELKQDLPISYIALSDSIPIGSCTLQLKDCVRPDLGPWIGDLVVDSKYQRQSIGKKLLEATTLKAKELGFKKIYLFAFDSGLIEYYGRLGWRKIAMDEFKSHPVTIMELRF